MAIRYLLAVDGLHVFGLTGESERQAQRGRTRGNYWFTPGQFVATIPKRELDDPPDSETAASTCEGLIVELSGSHGTNKEREDNKLS
mmetsp:Transcript_11343/g.16324  ORF Transcript_11343/g.16324 Transcript_11343/m.16324 type:complete len:87 (+) Transcript_11343:844-1104(+)